MLAALVAALPLAAVGQATATRSDSCTQESDSGCGTPFLTLTVNFTVPGPHAGRPGAFFIGARSTSGPAGDTRNINNDTSGLWIFTPRGWEAFAGGRYEPIEGFSALPARRSYVVLNQVDLCQLMGPVNVELWAGYGVLQPDKAEAVAMFHSVANPRVPPDHIRSVYVYNDMKDNQRYWNVLSTNACQGGASGPSDNSNGL